MPGFDEVTRSLSSFVGGSRLANIRIFHDFDWLSKFGSARREFKNGLRLTSLVKAECPVGSTPSLILLSRAGVEETILNEHPNYALVINVDAYMSSAIPDAAAAYFTLRRSANTRLEITSLLAQDRTLRDDVVIANLTTSYVMRWVSDNPSRIDELKGLLDSAIHDGSPQASLSADPAQIVDLLGRLEVVPETLVSTMISVLTRFATVPSEHQETLLQTILGTSHGRNVAAVEMGNRIADRVQDIRDSLRVYEALIGNTTSTETDTHEYIIENPWLLGLDYVRARHEIQISRGRVDFLLEKYDGSHDLMELKSPNHRIIVSGSDGVAASSPTQFRLSPELSNAIAQINRYLFVLDRDCLYLSSELGIEKAKHPKAYILIGKSSDCSPPELETLQQLNKSLHRIEIIPFDDLVLKCDAMLSYLERTISNPPELLAGQEVGAVSDE